MLSSVAANRQIAESPDRHIETVYPLRREHGHFVPFPTIYWLLPGDLHTAIADLERRGWIKQLEQRVEDEPELREQLHEAHRRYAAQRWAMLTPEDRAVVEAAPSLLRTFRGGVAGVAGFDHIKCLHAHAAHAIAEPGGNPVGETVLTMLGVVAEDERLHAKRQPRTQ